MVPYSEVANLCEMALAFSQKCSGKIHTVEDAETYDIVGMLPQLESRIAHDHGHRGVVSTES